MVSRTDRLLTPRPVADLAEHRALTTDVPAAIAEADPAALIELVADSGLRGRGGAGFPTGRKWQAVAEHQGALPPTVVVNGAEGEPGSFKDRTLLRRNPHRVLDGAFVAARAVGADAVVVVVKATFATEIARLHQAIDEMAGDVATLGVTVGVVEGPSSYLLGEETALLEVVGGRPPFPRLAPPYRHGVDELGDHAEPATTVMAAPGEASAEPPVVVNNVETLAHVADIVRHGADWFRERGTADAPGTALVTLTGDVAHPAVGEIEPGETLAEVIDRLAGGAAEVPMAALPGVSHPLVPAEHFDRPLGHGTGPSTLAIGSGAFRVFGASTDPVAVATGVSRFLAVESCGQCEPCKADGMALSDALARLVADDAQPGDGDEVRRRTRSVSTGARCALARQHEDVLASVLEHFPANLAAHLDGRAEPVEPVLVAPLVDLADDGSVEVDLRQGTKQPDWSHDPVWGGRYPVHVATPERASR